MEIEEIKNYELFKEIYEKKETPINFEEFDKFFLVRNYFLSRETPFLEEDFFKTLYELIGNMLKGQLTELEYYVNVKHSTPLANSDIEILSKENDKLMKCYFKMHIAYKKFHKINLLHKTNTLDVVEYLNENIELFKEINKYFIEIQDKLIVNLNKKLNEVEKKKEEKFQSCIFH